MAWGYPIETADLIGRAQRRGEAFMRHLALRDGMSPDEIKDTDSWAFSLALAKHPSYFTFLGVSRRWAGDIRSPDAKKNGTDKICFTRFYAPSKST